MQKWTRLISSPWSTKSHVDWRPNQAFSKVSRIALPRWPPSVKVSSSMIDKASVIQRSENVHRRECEHGSRAHHMQGEPTAQHALQKQLRVHLVNPKSVLGCALESAVR